MGRIARSFQLVGQSYRILMQDKELMVLPLDFGRSHHRGGTQLLLWLRS